MSYRPGKLGQYEPRTSTSADDCVCSVTASLIDRATVGGVRLDHQKIRRISGDTSGGLSYLQAEVAAAKAPGKVKLVVKYGISRDATKALATAGYAFGISIDCSVTVNTSRRTNWFRGGHTVYVNGYIYWPHGDVCSCELQTRVAHGEYTIDDPGTTSVGYLQWSAGLVYRAAEARTNGTGINVLVAPDTEAVTKRAIATGQIRSKPDKASPSKGAIVKGKAYYVEATVNGGTWQRADGTQADGWHRVKLPSGVGYIRGEALR